MFYCFIVLLLGLINTSTIEAVKVGLLIPGQRTDAKNGLAAKQAAEMAIAEANANGGFEGRPFKLIVRSLDGPWASGSKKIVKLIFEDSVHALMSSLGGRSAHLAEQIVAKARVAVAAGHPQPRQFSYEKSDSNFQNLLAQIEQTKIEAIVLFLQTSRTVKKLVQQMRVRQIDPALFGPLTLIDEAFLNMTDSGLDGAVFSSTAGAAVSGWRLICGLGWGSNAAARLAESAAHKVSHLFTITYAIYFSNINFRVSENLPACNL